MEALPRVAVAQKSSSLSPALPVKVHCISPGRTGHQHCRPLQLQVAKAKLLVRVAHPPGPLPAGWRPYPGRAGRADWGPHPPPPQVAHRAQVPREMQAEKTRGTLGYSSGSLLGGGGQRGGSDEKSALKHSPKDLTLFKTERGEAQA